MGGLVTSFGVGGGGESGRRTRTGKINFKKCLSPEKSEKKAHNENNTVNHKRFGDSQRFSRTRLRRDRGAMWRIHGTNGWCLTRTEYGFYTFALNFFAQRPRNSVGTHFSGGTPAPVDGAVRTRIDRKRRRPLAFSSFQPDGHSESVWKSRAGFIVRVEYRDIRTDGISVEIHGPLRSVDDAEPRVKLRRNRWASMGEFPTRLCV